MLAVFKCHGFDDALDQVLEDFLLQVPLARATPCGIYSFDDEHIDRLALMAPVSRIMVRQVPAHSVNAGAFTTACR